MSKNNKVEDVQVEDAQVEDVVTSEDKAKEAIQTLRVQLLEHQKQAEYHQTMSVKAQGALEVLLQLYPQEEKKEN